jgi:leader peptidase (prepilin peptidase)/N-methyltransferase
MGEHIGMPTFLSITATIILAAVLVRLVVLDLRTGRLPDIYTLPLIISGLALNAYWQAGLPTPQVWGAITGFLVFWMIGTFYHRYRGVDGLGLCP